MANGYEKENEDIKKTENVDFIKNTFVSENTVIMPTELTDSSPTSAVSENTVIFGNGEENGDAEFAKELESKQEGRVDSISEQIQSSVTTTDGDDAADGKSVSEQNKKASRITDLFDFVETLVFAVSFVVLTFTFLFMVVFVDGDSMSSTLEDKDLLIISDIADYTYGDIVIFMPENAKSDPRQDKRFIKRIIALEGDTVDIDYENQAVYVNGKQIEEDYLHGVTMLNRGDITFPYTVPEHHVFFMGDNRNVSWDSRYGDVGTVDVRQIFGKVVVRLFPFDRIGFVE